MDFNSLGISGRLLEAVATAGYVEPTSVQEKVIPHVLQGRDILASAQTGSGKTAAFILPLVDMLGSKRAGKRMPRALILEPTRELAAQVQEVMTNLGCNHDLESSLLIGGVSFKNQRDELKNSPDVLIATPGRLLDHIERGTVLLNEIALLVIDEADRMLDMGFLPDVRRILSFLPPRRQSLLFSATLPDDILALSKNFMNDVKMVKASPMSSASQDVKHYLKMVDKRDKGDVMVDLVRSVSPVIERSIIFCNRKRDISSLVTKLRYNLKETSLTIAGLHGDMDQSARTRTLNGFRKGDIRLLVASDVAARGIDVEDVTHVFLNDVPISAEDYIHRSGRTGRAGKQGQAYTLATLEEEQNLDAIEELLARGKQKFEPIPREDNPTARRASPDEKISPRSGNHNHNHNRNHNQGHNQDQDQDQELPAFMSKPLK